MFQLLEFFQFDSRSSEPLLVEYAYLDVNSHYTSEEIDPPILRTAVRSFCARSLTTLWQVFDARQGKSRFEESRRERYVETVNRGRSRGTVLAAANFLARQFLFWNR